MSGTHTLFADVIVQTIQENIKVAKTHTNAYEKTMKPCEVGTFIGTMVKCRHTNSKHSKIILLQK